MQMLEKHNRELQKQINDLRLRGLLPTNSPPQIKSSPTQENEQNLFVPKQIRKESCEYPADEDHKKLVKEFEADYPEENCKQQ